MINVQKLKHPVGGADLNFTNKLYLMAKLIKTDSTEEDVFPTNNKTFSLKELQKLVDGPIEIVYPSRSVKYNNKLLVINELGKLRYLEHNDKATRIYNNPYDYICGNALLCDNSEIK